MELGVFLQIGEAGIPHRHHIAGEFASGLHIRRPGLSIGLGLLKNLVARQCAVIS